MPENPTYVLNREFNAPRQLVWRAWTEADLLVRWYGPNVETVVHRLDVRRGGLWLNEMKMGDNSSYQRTEFIEVVEPERIVCLMGTADANWNIVANPHMPNWPRILKTTVTFETLGSKTNMQLVWQPHEASEAEIACFADAIEGMGRGWGAGFDKLELLLAELRD